MPASLNNILKALPFPQYHSPPRVFERAFRLHLYNCDIVRRKIMTDHRSNGSRIRVPRKRRWSGRYRCLVTRMSTLCLLR